MLTAPVVFETVPGDPAVTLMLKLQEVLAASDPADRPTEVDPAVTPVAVPPQLFKASDATEMPLVKVSVKAIPVNAVAALGFWMLKFSVTRLPTSVAVGLNDVVTVGDAPPATV